MELASRSIITVNEYSLRRPPQARIKSLTRQSAECKRRAWTGSVEVFENGYSRPRFCARAGGREPLFQDGLGAARRDVGDPAPSAPVRIAACLVCRGQCDRVFVRRLSHARAKESQSQAHLRALFRRRVFLPSVVIVRPFQIRADRVAMVCDL